MTLEQQIESLSKELAKVKRKISILESERMSKQVEYITAPVAERMFDVSQSTIRRYRKIGRLTDFKVALSGRRYKYSVDQLEKVFKNDLS